MTWPTNLKEIPAVKKVMSPFPYSVELDSSLDQAREMMDRHAIHHLPVVSGGTLLGVISHADLMRAMDQRRRAGARQMRVADVHREKALVTDLSTPLDRLLQQMADERMEVALVVKDERLAGIFTVTDACRHFAANLRQQFPPAGGDEAA